MRNEMSGMALTSTKRLLECPEEVVGGMIVDGVTTMADCVPDAMANWPASIAEQEYVAFVDDRLTISVPGCDADRTRGFVNMEGPKGRVLTLLRV